MDDQVTELRRITSILLIAHAEAIQGRLNMLMAHPPSRSLIELLGSGEMKTDQLETAAKARGVARSTMYKSLADLERVGVVERPRRGSVALTEVAAAFAASVNTARGAVRAQDGGGA
jgi:hypothetical protein